MVVSKEDSQLALAHVVLELGDPLGSELSGRVGQERLD